MSCGYEAVKSHKRVKKTISILRMTQKIHGKYVGFNLGFMVVDTFEKHLLGSTQSKYSPWPLVLTSPSRVSEN